jgi:hypothetical protein
MSTPKKQRSNENNVQMMNILKIFCVGNTQQCSIFCKNQLHQMKPTKQ